MAEASRLQTLLTLEERQLDIDESFKAVYSEFYDTIERILSDQLLDDGTKSLIGRLQTDYFLKLTILECVLTGKDTATAKEANAVKYLIEFYIQQALVIMDKILKVESNDSI